MSAKEEIEVLINRSREAQKQIENYTQEQVDELIRAMVWSVAKPGMAEEIAQFTVDETQLGNYDGKSSFGVAVSALIITVSEGDHEFTTFEYLKSENHVGQITRIGRLTLAGDDGEH